MRHASASVAALQACAGWAAFELSLAFAADVVPGPSSPIHGLELLAVFALAVPLLVGALALILRLGGERLRDIGLVRPARGWTRSSLIGLACVPPLLAGAWLVASAASELGLSDGGDVFDLSPLSVAGFLVAAPLGGGFGEELFYRGFLQSRLERAFGSLARPRTATLLALCATSAVFGLDHLYQGWLGVVVVTYYGLALGALHLAAKRELPIPMIAHGGIDVVSFLVLPNA